MVFTLQHLVSFEQLEHYYQRNKFLDSVKLIANFESQESNSKRGLQGVNPSVEHFRVFGCAAHVQIPIARKKY